MKDAQDRLDKGAAMLLRLIKATEQGAEEACAAGEFGASERLHKMAGHMRIAYGIGRGLVLSDGTAATRRKD
jgi:hypothetical protein